MKANPTGLPFDRGVFTVSLDFELIWGTLDLFGPEPFRQACEQEREAVVELLEMFTAHGLCATWCIQGHLFLDRCAEVGGRKHPEIVRPTFPWCCGDWFDHDPCGSEDSDPIFYGRSLVEKIRDCPVHQEVGCHGFSHVIFGDTGCPSRVARSELAECLRLAEELRVQMNSFAFPRNRIGHLDLLPEFGFTAYRGLDRTWYRNAPRRLARWAHLWDVLTASTPPVVLPERTSHGLWNIPGSMIYFPMHGLRRFLPMGIRVRRALKGLDAAARSRKVFHLWFHPTNVAESSHKMLGGLGQILDHAARLRDKGLLEFLTMGDLATKCERSLRVRESVMLRDSESVLVGPTLG